MHPHLQKLNINDNEVRKNDKEYTSEKSKRSTPCAL